MFLQSVALNRVQCLHFFRHVCLHLSVDYSEPFGLFLVNDAMSKYSEDNESIRGEALRNFLESVAFKPYMDARKPKRCLVLGGGAYGTAITKVLSRKGHHVCIVMLDSERECVEAVNTKHHNPYAFPDVPLHPRLVTATCISDIGRVMQGVEYIVMAVPVQYTFKYLRSIKDVIPHHVPIISVSKGIETSTLHFMSEIIPRALGRNQPSAFLGGPSFAKDMVNSLPTCVSVAAQDLALAQEIQLLFSSSIFRVFTTNDVMGVQVGSALKNVLAIACGVVSGLGYGPNTQTAIVTRGWADIRAISKSVGARESTMTGLAGIGDLMLTCFGGLSRNNRFGKVLATTGDVQAALEKAGGTVEGLPTSIAITELARKKNLRLPVLEAISAMLNGSLSPKSMISHIMTLPLSHEEAGLSVPFSKL